MKTYHKVVSIQTEECLQFMDLTDEVENTVKESGIKNGLVNVQTNHTTAMLILNENEPLLIEDMKEHLDIVSPIGKEYRHDNFDIRTVNMCDDECANGHSHCKALHLNSSLTLNLLQGKIQFGTWQRVMFIELDRSRSRKVQIMVIGE